MNATEYKRYHESFMENNEGSSLLHTFFCIFYTVQCAIKIAIKQRDRPECMQYLQEYVFIILSMTLVHTVAPTFIHVLIFIDTSFIIYQLSKVLKTTHIYKTLMSPNSFKTERIQSISFIRGLTYLITVFCILAVDFRDFPRFLAKTERFGYSLMDTGVGLFVLMSGLVHRDLTKHNKLSVIKGNLKFITTLVVLGTARFVSVKQLDYQEHISEYGVHWNFFFTLAVCKFFSSILLCFFSQPLLLSIFIITLHEFLLQNSLQEWVFSNASRTSFVEANREGIASSLGYISMYLFGAYLKKVINNRTHKRWKILVKFSCASLLLGFLSYYVNIVKPASRMLANAGYCLYVEAILMIVMTLVYVLEMLSQDEEIDFCFEIPLILSNVNKNGLVYFLIANLSTGLINLSMQSLFVPTLAAIVIINVYMIFTLTVTDYLHQKGISV